MGFWTTNWIKNWWVHSLLFIITVRGLSLSRESRRISTFPPRWLLTTIRKQKKCFDNDKLSCHESRALRQIVFDKKRIIQERKLFYLMPSRPKFYFRSLYFPLNSLIHSIFITNVSKKIIKIPLLFSLAHIREHPKTFPFSRASFSGVTTMMGISGNLFIKDKQILEYTRGVWSTPPLEGNVCALFLLLLSFVC
jgi:hypothetical protein